jgi:hypothetical protein
MVSARTTALHGLYHGRFLFRNGGKDFIRGQALIPNKEYKDSETSGDIVIA